MNALNFLETLTLDQFKSQNQASIKVFAKDKGHWFRCGGVSGHVSQTVTSFSNPSELLISLVETDDGQFWMMHKAGQQEVVAEL
jgi:hypothetical protein